MIAISIKNLSKNFDGVVAVNNLYMKIKLGDITSIIGPNGAGKTTLVNILSGMLSFESGTVSLFGCESQNIKAYQVASKGLTRTFQNVRLFEQITVLDNVLLAITSRGVVKSFFERNKKEDVNKAITILKQVGLAEKQNELASNLSYGQRKLLEIARTLAMDVEIYLFDEPFAGLFPEMVKIVVEIIKDLKQKNKTIILIEHNMDLIRELSDQVIVLDGGEFLASGEPAEVLSKKEVIEAYLGE